MSRSKQAEESMIQDLSLILGQILSSYLANFFTNAQNLKLIVNDLVKIQKQQIISVLCKKIIELRYQNAKLKEQQNINENNRQVNDVSQSSEMNRQKQKLKTIQQQQNQQKQQFNQQYIKKIQNMNDQIANLMQENKYLRNIIQVKLQQKYQQKKQNAAQKDNKIAQLQEIIQIFQQRDQVSSQLHQKDLKRIKEQYQSARSQLIDKYQDRIKNIQQCLQQKQQQYNHFIIQTSNGGTQSKLKNQLNSLSASLARLKYEKQDLHQQITVNMQLLQNWMKSQLAYLQEKFSRKHFYRNKEMSETCQKCKYKQDIISQFKNKNKSIRRKKKTSSRVITDSREYGIKNNHMENEALSPPTMKKSQYDELIFINSKLKIIAKENSDYRSRIQALILDVKPKRIEQLSNI